MGQKLVVGPINKGLKTNVTAFNIDPDSFPTLINAYQWRGRVKRKRGTSFLNRLQRFFNSNNASYGSIASFALVANEGNLITSFNLETNASIIPGSVSITVGANTYTDLLIDGTLQGNPGGSGTINYASGDITIAGGGVGTVSGSFLYYPTLPVLGLRDLILTSTQFAKTLAFDTIYSYNVNTFFPYTTYDVSFYKNPNASATLPGYAAKTVVTPTSWNGRDYQQFSSVNYENVFWVTNGISAPFVTSNIGMQFKRIVNVTIGVGGPPAIVNLQITNHGLKIGDFLFINEVLSTTGINFQTGYVTVLVDNNNVTVEFPSATIATNGTGGIAQYLTSRADTTIDCIRYYDGDPTNTSTTSPILNGDKGWVNFMPPLSFSNFSIGEQTALQYYLVGCLAILPFKDRLCFFGAVIQSSGGDPIYIQDLVVYSQNGTPFYTASFTGDPTFANTLFAPLLVPDNQTATASAYFEDQTGFGGFKQVGLQQSITSVGRNQDVIIVGLSDTQTRMVYSGNDVLPFEFYIINSELGTSSTFSSVMMDQGVISKGTRGYIMTNQNGAERIDLEIPDEVFQVNLVVNGNERTCSQRDFQNEWIYFTYPSNQVKYKFPNQTLQYNYRDNSWAVFDEAYTTYGSFRVVEGSYTWANIGTIYETWSEWNDPWNSGNTTVLQPDVIAGNQQGFILFRAQGTGEGTSLYIQSFTNNLVTSPDHCLNEGDFIVISECIGTVGTLVNNKIFQVLVADNNTFFIAPLAGTGTYLGGGKITRMYVPFIQTMQFPVAWSNGRKTRIGVQQYLLTNTPNGQITLQIYLSQNNEDPYTNSNIVPDSSSTNNSLIYSQILYTCPESTNLGLTPANINLNSVTALNQSQIWHRKNTSLIGDTVQIGFTMSKEQMMDPTFSNQFVEIELHGFILDVNSSQLLS